MRNRMVLLTTLVFLGRIFSLLAGVQAFSISCNIKLEKARHFRLVTKLHLSNSNVGEIGAENLVHLRVIASSGLTAEEFPIILPEIISSVDDHFGMEIISDDNMIQLDSNLISESIPGATGRVILLSLENVAKDWNKNDERLEPFKSLISQKIDSLVGFQIDQPILVSILPNFEVKEVEISETLKQIVKDEIFMYDLCTPIGQSDLREDEREEILSITHIKIDGANIMEPYSEAEKWDTSSILVFDDFVDNSLRESLLDVVNQRGVNYNWDDKIKGPDTSRWKRGGLVDIFEESENVPTCWGLTEEATEDLCFNHHDAIEKVEQKISDFFHEFIVTRLPEAVLGSCVSPLTANAPTCGDSFSYHIDADPNQTPPSPWTDVYGRYFNRVRGKPRFLSCLIYLNDEWDEEYGAPTEFRDPPTDETYKVYPRPGRVVMMDQDITHTVVAPNKAAGALPRYSLVWKLIIHPKKIMQNMDLPIKHSTKSIEVGSARK